MKYREAIARATLDIMDADPRVIVMGEGVADPKGIFGTTKLAHDKYPDRVIETPLSENMLTGALAGLACEGWKPIYVHARAEFSLLAWEHMVNTIAKWPWLHGGQRLPIIIRMLVGRGWGQGPTHSQSFHGMLAQVPGLKVCYPVDSVTASSYISEAHRCGGPTIIIEPRRMYECEPLVYPQRWTPDINIVTIGDAILEGIAAATALENQGICVNVAPLQDFSYPLFGLAPVYGPVIVVETMRGYTGGMVLPLVMRDYRNIHYLQPPPSPLPTAAHLEARWYPSVDDILDAAEVLLGIAIKDRAISTTEQDGRKDPF